MKIIIAGAGDVGFHLARLLANEEHDLVIVDMDSEKLKYVANHLDVATIKGNSTSPSVLQDANISEADLLICATSSEDTNLLTAILGKRMGVKKTVTRISNLEFLLNRQQLGLEEMGIDEVVSPESLAAREISRLLKESAITDVYEFEKEQLSLIGINIDATDPLKNKTLRETTHLNPDLDFLTVAILRNNRTIIPRGDTKFELGDHVYYIAQPSGVDKVLKLTGKKSAEINSVMILGGSRVGFHTAKRLENKYKTKLIELDKEKCFDLADQLDHTLVINGDGRDMELLEEEGISNTDAFIAVTGNSETNIISCLMAKNKGVKKTIALVENIDYIHLSQNIGVDTMINKKLIAANFTFRYIRKGSVLSITSVHGVDAEILEFRVKENSKITKKPLKKLHFPYSAIVGGVIRNDKAYTPMGDFVFEPNDRVVVLSRMECIRKIEEFFK
ncbi:Trk system potassium transporter TrkA [Rapidithrix thailandica]|uniref:Trk system potassium uptake protein TrkA n=1 Tax=Rapidithrix thailandica TaxID=413964 RepID=A0AAW9SKK7_9BACT